MRLQAHYLRPTYLDSHADDPPARHPFRVFMVSPGDLRVLRSYPALLARSACCSCQRAVWGGCMRLTHVYIRQAGGLSKAETWKNGENLAEKDS